jgi:hypothetical protein
MLPGIGQTGNSKPIGTSVALYSRGSPRRLESRVSGHDFDLRQRIDLPTSVHQSLVLNLATVQSFGLM